MIWCFCWENGAFVRHAHNGSMAKADFDALYRLHKIDAVLHDIRQRAAALDAGQSIQKKMEALRPEYDEAVGAAKRADTELKDVDLQRQARAEKIKKLDKELYGGKVVNPREIEALQKEIEMLRAHQDDAEMRELELMDALPPLKERAARVEAQMAELQKEMVAKRQAALKAKVEMEAQFKEAQASRGAAAKAVPAPLLAQYEAILKRVQGVALAEITPKGACGRCRTQLPTKTVILAQESKWVTCEECHRILIWVPAT